MLATEPCHGGDEACFFGWEARFSEGYSNGITGSSGFLERDGTLGRFWVGPSFPWDLQWTDGV